MRYITIAAAMMLLLAACSASGSPTSRPAPTARQSPPAATSGAPLEPSGVLMTTDSQLNASHVLTYHLAVASMSGHVVRQVSAAAPSVSAHLPRFSAAGQDVYFIDGDSQVRVLRADGSVSDVRQLPGGPSDRVIFSVSPDEKLIAYTVFHVKPTEPCPPGPPCFPTVTSVVLRLANLDGTGQQVLLSGTTVQYPVGWAGGRLILASGPPFIQNMGEVNPYFASTYRVVNPGDPAQGAITVTCPGGYLTGAIVPAGTACVRGSTVQRLDWAGSAPVDLGVTTVTAGTIVAALSPNGSRAAVATFDGSGRMGPLEIVAGGRVTDTGHGGLAAGWFDARSLLYVANPGVGPAIVVAEDIDHGTSAPVDLGASLGAIDSYAPFFTSLGRASS